MERYGLRENRVHNWLISCAGMLGYMDLAKLYETTMGQKPAGIMYLACVCGAFSGVQKVFFASRYYLSPYRYMAATAITNDIDSKLDGEKDKGVNNLETVFALKDQSNEGNFLQWRMMRASSNTPLRSAIR